MNPVNLPQPMSGTEPPTREEPRVAARGMLSGFADFIAAAVDRLRSTEVEASTTAADIASPADAPLPAPAEHAASDLQEGDSERPLEQEDAVEAAAVILREIEFDTAGERAIDATANEQVRMEDGALEVILPAEEDAVEVTSPAPDNRAESGRNFDETVRVDAEALRLDLNGGDSTTVSEVQPTDEKISTPQAAGTPSLVPEPDSDPEAMETHRMPSTPLPEADSAESALPEPDLDGDVKIVAARRASPIVDETGMAEAGESNVERQDATDSPRIGAASGGSTSDTGSQQHEEPSERDLASDKPPAVAGTDAAADVENAIEQDVMEAPTSEALTDAEAQAPDRANLAPTDASRATTHAPERAGAPTATLPRSPITAAWLKAMMDNGIRLDASADGWNSLTLQLGESDGTMTVDARRDDERVAVQVAFSDPHLRATAAQHVDRLESALRAHYGTSVELSLGEHGSANHQQGETGRPPTGNAGSSDHTPHHPSQPHRSIAPGATYEWIG